MSSKNKAPQSRWVYAVIVTDDDYDYTSWYNDAYPRGVVGVYKTEDAARKAMQTYNPKRIGRALNINVKNIYNPNYLLDLDMTIEKFFLE